jgi:F-type H+-transporting ATPase subunit b
MKKSFQNLFMIILMSLISVSAMAGGDGGSSTQIPQAVNLLILIIAIAIFAGKGLKSGLQSRADSVAKEILEAQKLHQEAKQLLDEYQAQLNDLQSKKDELIEQYRAEGEREKAQLIADGEKEAQRLKDHAKQQAEQQLLKAQGRIEKEVVDAALKRARTLLVEKINVQDQQRLTSEYVVSLEKLPQSQA